MTTYLLVLNRDDGKKEEEQLTKYQKKKLTMELRTISYLQSFDKRSK